MKEDTRIIQAAKAPFEHKGMVNTPVYRTSTVLFSSMKAYHEAESQKRDYSYGTSGTPTSFALEQALAELDGVEHALVYSSGLSAITTTLLAFLAPGDHLLMVDNVYGPTRRFCSKILKRLGVETTYYDPLIGAEISTLIKDNTKLVFTESPGSLTFEVSDIPAIVTAAKAKDVLVVMDNSWASPLFFRPFEHGVDIAIQACTKYVSGHSDALMGAATTNNPDLYTKLFDMNHNLGLCVGPDDCYLVSRGLRTLPVRLRHHERSTIEIAKWLEGRDEVSQVLFPALESHPGHALWQRDFKGAGGLLTFMLDRHYPYEAICKMIDGMKVFCIGASWGGYESLILHINPAAIRTAKKWTNTASCVRIYVGLEDIEDLKSDLANGFERLKSGA